MRRLLQAALWAAAAHAITIAPGWEQRLTNELHKIARNESQKYNCSVSIAFRSARVAGRQPTGAVDPTGAPATTSDVRLGQRHEGRDRRVDPRLVADGHLALDDAAACTWTASYRGWAWRGRSATLGRPERLQTTVRDLLGMTSSVPDPIRRNPCFPAL